MLTSEFLHRMNRLVTSSRLKFAAALFADLASIRYTIVRVDPVSACNLRCGMCFFSDASWRAQHAKGHLTKADLERIAFMMFPQALQVHFGASMEPTAFKDYPWLVELAKRHGVPFVGFTTNGQLLTPEGIERLIAAGLDEITVSTHGVRKETYERLMRGASFEKHHNMLSRLAASRSRVRAPKLRINFTVNPDNLEELRHFQDVYGKYDITTVQIRPVFDFGDTEYKNKALSKHLGLYNEILSEVIGDCRKQGIRVLANVSDPTHQDENKAAYVYRKAFLRFVNPELVWRKEFDWRRESLSSFQRRVAWRRELASEVIWPNSKPSAAAQAAVFDVF
jgi:pyruvate-formate lyase-activating enzyme